MWIMGWGMEEAERVNNSESSTSVLYSCALT